MQPPRPIVVLSGSRGYIGSRLMALFQERGWAVRELGRLARLGDEPPAAAFQDAAAFVHAAYDFLVCGWREIHRLNVEGSIRFLDAAQRAGVPRVVFLSSISAYPDAASLYGRAKFLVEQEVLRRGGHALRLGLVWGPTPEGVFGRLAALCARLPLIPLVGGGRPVFPLHESDAVREIVALVASPHAPAAEVWTLAEPEPVSFRELLAAAARASGREPHFVPMPLWPVALALDAVEALGFRPRLRADGLRGLLQPNPAVDFGPLRRKGIVLKRYVA